MKMMKNFSLFELKMNTCETFKSYEANFLNLTDTNGVAHDGYDAIVLQFFKSVFKMFASDELKKFKNN